MSDKNYREWKNIDKSEWMRPDCPQISCATDDCEPTDAQRWVELFPAPQPNAGREKILLAMKIRNGLYEMAGLSADARQALNDKADDYILAALAEAQPNAGLRESGFAHEGVWCCERKSKCKWQCFALHQGLSWGTCGSPQTEWITAHQRECGGKLIQLLPGSDKGESQPVTHFEKATMVCVNCRQVQMAHGPDGVCPPQYPFKWFGGEAESQMGEDFREYLRLEKIRMEAESQKGTES
jgi:hypothetical protein